MSWQPIETAPKDKWILLIDDEPDWAGNMYVAKWFGDDEEYACFWTSGGPNGGIDLCKDFTHWMPLPNPPTMIKGE